MDLAAMAAASDPASNWHFRRRWSDPPLLKRERPPRDREAPPQNSIDSEATYSGVDAAAQRATYAAIRHADRLARQAALLSDIGLTDAALRTAELVRQLREVAR